MLSLTDLSDYVVDQWLPDWRQEKLRLERIDRWLRWSPDDHPLPQGATREAKALLELSRTTWLGLVVTSTAQAMYVDGYRSRHDPIKNRAIAPPEAEYPAPLPYVPPELPEPEQEDEPEGPWRIWLANGLDKHQTAIHRSALAYGYSFVTVLPGTDPMTGDSMPQIRGVSPMRMWATWDDPAQDDWPEYAMQVLRCGGEDGTQVKVFDSTHAYTVTVLSETEPVEGKARVRIDKVEHHGAGVCPVVRFTNQLDLEGRADGEVEPHIPLAARINKTSYDRALTQHFNSWKIRWIAGLNEPDTEEDANRQKLKLKQDQLLIFEDPDTKTGSLPETTLDGFIRAHEADVEALAAVTQTPTHELTGKLVNLSAEALAAARASQTQKIYERQKSFGAAYAQVLRLAAHLDGQDKYAKDITGRVTWQDTSIRSLSQSTDALGKMAQMLQVPVEALWSRIPGVEKSDVEEWRRLALSLDPLTKWQYEMQRQAITYTPSQPEGGAVGEDAPATGASAPAAKPTPKPTPKPPARR